ncbi:phospho-N-acetylmuramoyl-pentapeptide-transferase [Blattabacterium cuenoti]|uniref:phospho-N-acetylmuramoyl-pentapeptide- transferase n=1 Tax=Blattabacterium cuenoti TaxID=1653831 RepID=UPI00163D39C5|nr:phospho-N-acetylmuramoyl-pentapeptide-transferase [Blattabacterium cuenoti]
MIFQSFKNFIPDSYFFVNSIFFRSGIAFILSICIALIFYQKIICWNHRKNKIGEHIRDLGLVGQKEKEGTPTMGGIIIIISALIPTFFLSTLDNVYVMILIVTTLYMGCLGFIDDYIKIKYNNKNGLNVIGKIFGQIILGIFIGSTMSFHKKITIKKIDHDPIKNIQPHLVEKEKHVFKTTLPLIVQSNSFDYACILRWYNKKWEKYAWVIFIPIVILITVSLSNGANLTDGMDGLTAGISSIILLTLFLLSLISSNKNLSFYLHSLYIPNIGEIFIFFFSFLGSLIVFLWYNTYPAQIFMGDTGSLTIGGVISALAIITRKELILPILCGIFFMENLSVIIQVLYFKCSKRKYGIGKRIFLMAPLHHHFQKLGYHERKIVNRFFIIQMMLSIIVLILLIIN